MRAARMYGYKQPLVLEDVKKPEITPEQVLVRVEAAGMCRTDLQLVDGYFRAGFDLPLPAIPGHEIAGSIAELGDSVSATANLAVGDQVVVVGGWGRRRVLRVTLAVQAGMVRKPEKTGFAKLWRIKDLREAAGSQLTAEKTMGKRSLAPQVKQQNLLLGEKVSQLIESKENAI